MIEKEAKSSIAQKIFSSKIWKYHEKILYLHKKSTTSMNIHFMSLLLRIFYLFIIILLLGNLQMAVAQKPIGTWYEANGYSTTITEKKTVTKQQLLRWLSEPFVMAEAFDVYENDSCGLEITMDMTGNGTHVWGYKDKELHCFGKSNYPGHDIAIHWSAKISYDEKRQILYLWNSPEHYPDTYIVNGIENGELKCLGRDFSGCPSPNLRCGYYTFKHDNRNMFSRLYKEWIRHGKANEWK